jgi:3',5'-cyclic AMP phosphodiesterase CpdA
MSEPPFRVAHISDLHLGPLPKASVRELMGKRVTGWTNWHLRRRSGRAEQVARDLAEDLIRQRVDHIICSGDICNLGLAAEATRAREFLESLGPPERVSFVPGNHDAYVRDSLERLLDALGPYVGDPPPKFPRIRECGPFVLFLLSSAIPTAPFFSAGALGDAQLSAFAGMLAAYGESPLIRTVVLHHPPAKSLAGRRKGLRDRERFLDIVGETGADLILYGHNHRPDITRIKGLPLIGAPSFSLPGRINGAASPPGYRIISAPTGSADLRDIVVETRFWSVSGVSGSFQTLPARRGG